MKNSTAIFRYIFPGFYTLMIALFFMSVFNDIGVSINSSEINEKSLLKFINITIIGFSIGFVEYFILFPLFNTMTSQLKRFFNIKKTKFIGKHKEFIIQTIEIVKQDYSDKYDFSNDEINENTIFDSYFNKYLNNNELSRLFFLSSKRYLFKSSLIITKISFVIAVGIFLYLFINNVIDKYLPPIDDKIYMISISIVVFLTLIFHFKNNLNATTSHLRLFELDLLKTTKPSLKEYINTLVLNSKTKKYEKNIKSGES